MQVRLEKQKVCDSSFLYQLQNPSFAETDVGNAYLGAPRDGLKRVQLESTPHPPPFLAVWKVVYCVVVTSFFVPVRECCAVLL